MTHDTNRDEKPDWNRLIASELIRIRTMYGESSAEELAFLKRLGEERFRHSQDDSYPLLDLSTEAAENAIGIYSTHMAKLHKAGDPSLIKHKDALNGWMFSTPYSDRDLYKALEIQSFLIGRFATLSDQGEEHWQQIGRNGRVDEINMVLCAAEKIMAARGYFKECPTAILAKYRVEDKIVTDAYNPCLKPNKEYEPLDEDAYYLPAMFTIGFGLYKDRDCTSDRREAYGSAGHEGGHRLSDMWRNIINKQAVDNRLCSHGKTLLKLFKENFEKTPNEESPAYQNNKEAYEAIYCAQPDEILARKSDQDVLKYYGLRNISASEAETYIAILGDDPQFAPIVEGAKAHLAVLKSSNENKTNVPAPGWTNSSTTTSLPRFS